MNDYDWLGMWRRHFLWGKVFMAMMFVGFVSTVGVMLISAWECHLLEMFWHMALSGFYVHMQRTATGIQSSTLGYIRKEEVALVAEVMES